MEEKVIKKVDEKIKEIIDDDITTNNLEYLYQLSKIKHLAKEDKEMYGNYGRNYYGNYGRNGYGDGSYGEYGRGNYGEYGNYGRSYGKRGRDSKYRGDDELDRMYGEYGRYQENRERYGAGEETDKSFYYMVQALEDFIKVLEEEANSPQQKQQLKQALQNAMM